MAQHIDDLERVIDGEATVAVIKAVAERLECDPLEMPPLHEEINADALNNLVAHNGDIELTFRYANVDVHIDGDRLSILD